MTPEEIKAWYQQALACDQTHRPRLLGVGIAELVFLWWCEQFPDRLPLWLSCAVALAGLFVCIRSGWKLWRVWRCPVCSRSLLSRRNRDTWLLSFPYFDPGRCFFCHTDFRTGETKR